MVVVQQVNVRQRIRLLEARMNPPDPAPPMVVVFTVVGDDGEPVAGDPPADLLDAAREKARETGAGRAFVVWPDREAGDHAR